MLAASLRADGRFRPLMLQSAIEGRDLDGRKIAETAAQPLAVVTGGAEPYVNNAFLGQVAYRNLWDGKRFLFGEIRLEGEVHLVRLQKRLAHVGAACGRRARYPGGQRSRPASHHLQRRMSAERPAHRHRAFDLQLVEQRHRRIREAMNGIGGGRVRRVRTLPMPRQVESDEAVSLGHWRGELPSEHFLAGGIAVNEE